MLKFIYIFLKCNIAYRIVLALYDFFLHNRIISTKKKIALLKKNFSKNGRYFKVIKVTLTKFNF